MTDLGVGDPTRPYDLAFGPDGHLYVSVPNVSTIKKLNSSTAAASGALANDNQGISFSQGGNNQVGGTLPVQRNIISGNNQVGIQIESSASAAPVLRLSRQRQRGSFGYRKCRLE